MWPRKWIFLKIVRCSANYQILRWFANRWNRTASVLFVTIAYKLHLHRYFTLEVLKYIYKNNNFIIHYIFRLSRWGWITCNEHVLLNLQVWFSPPSLSESALVFLVLTTCSLEEWWRMLILTYTLLLVKILFHPCKIGREPYTDAGRRPYDMCPHSGIFVFFVRKWKINLSCD